MVSDAELDKEPSLFHFDQSNLKPQSQLNRRIRALIERIWAKNQLGVLKETIEQTDQAHRNSQAVLERLQGQLKEDRDKANQDADNKTAVLNLLAHEVRTPINGIMGMVQWFSESPINAEQREYIQALERSSCSMLEMVNSLLDWGKLEAGQVQPLSRQVHLPDLATEMTSMFCQAAQEKDLSLSFNTDQATSIIEVDETKLRQILTNLISNGVKYTNTGSVSVQMSLNKKDSSLEVQVVDTGIGVSPEKIKDLFVPFWQVEAWGETNNQGSGLGLAIVERLVNILGGELTVESQPDIGTTFSFALPVTLIAPSKRLQIAAPKQSPSTYLQALQTHLMSASHREAKEILQRFALATQVLGLVNLQEDIQKLEKKIGQDSAYEVLCQFEVLQLNFIKSTLTTNSGAA